MKILWFSSLFFTLLTSVPSISGAQTSAKIQGFLIEADQLSRDSDKEIVELQGRVQIIKDDQHISCDVARLFLRQKKIELLGHVKIVSSKNTVGGDLMNLDYEGNTGMIYNGYVQSGSVIFEGKTLEKISETEYYVTEADYTTCTNCPASWSFKGQRIRAELGGYAYIKSSVLSFGSFPVLWLPYLIVPLKSDRQSGLLTPEFEQSSEGGVAFAESFFWAIDRSQDATISFKNYERRGLKPLLNYRYVLNENSSGEFDAAMIRDRVFKNNDYLNRFRKDADKNSEINRWFFKYNHYFELPENIVNRVQLVNTSDLQYSKDFPLETGNYGDSAMENRVSLSQNFENFHWHIDSSYYTNQLRANPLADNEDSVHRMPEVSFSKTLSQIPNSSFYYSLDFNYTHFARSSKSYDDLTNPVTLSGGGQIRYIENNNSASTPSSSGSINCDNSATCHPVSDGKYTPYKDLIRTGHRTDFQPSLYYPMQMTDGIDLFPKLSYQETHYNFEVGDDRTNIRRLVRTELTTRATFSRVYGDLTDPISNRLLHEIQPEIKYTRIPWIDHRSHPFFGFEAQNEAPISSKNSISDGDLGSTNGLQFDYNDRIYDSHLITLGFINRWVEKEWSQNTPLYRQLALLKVSQSYDVYQASRNIPNKEPWSDIATVLNVRLNQFETYTNLNYYPYQKVTNTSSRFRFTNEQNQFFQLGLTRTYTIVSGQDVDTKSRVEDYTVAAGFQSSKLNLMGKLVYDGNWLNSKDNQQIKSWAYIAQFKPPGDCWLITFIHDQSTSREINFRLNFEFTFDGVPKPGLPPETLDKFGF